MKPKSNIWSIVGFGIFSAATAIASRLWDEFQLKNAVEEEVKRQLSEKNLEDEEET